MTGFARAQGQSDRVAWTLEARSVNGKGLDVRCRLPAGWEELEGPTRAAVTGRFKRGNISLTLSVDNGAATTRTMAGKAT